MRISIVVPAFNESRYLPRLLDTVERARNRYRRGRNAIEVIVADNGSTDGTPDIAHARGCKVIAVQPRNIAAVRNAGARIAHSALLAFVDADTQVHPETFNAIDDYFAAGDAVVGVTGAYPERDSLPITLGWGLVGGVTALLRFGVPRRYSECMPTGVVACPRDDWEALGGYPESWAFAEDARFLLELAKRGRGSGRRFGWIHGAPAIVSTRKFDAHGDWHYVTLPARMAMWMLFDPQAMNRWVADYWYGRQRETSSRKR